MRRAPWPGHPPSSSRGARGTQKDGRTDGVSGAWLATPRPPPPPLVAQPPRNGRGERGEEGGGASPRPARPGSDLPPPGGRARTRSAACPPCATCAAGPGLHERGGHLAGSGVSPSGFLSRSRRGEESREQRARGFFFLFKRGQRRRE